jgi:phosphopantetheine--protein transferase-like protein
MIRGIGVDTIDIERFVTWHTYLPKKLRRIFSTQEIEYCLENTQKSAERFAARFAAREALYKALSSFYPHPIPFLTLCAHTTIKKVDSRPVLELRSGNGIDASQFTIHLSLSHSRTQAMAFVIIESA